MPVNTIWGNIFGIFFTHTYTHKKNPVCECMPMQCDMPLDWGGGRGKCHNFFTFANFAIKLCNKEVERYTKTQEFFRTLFFLFFIPNIFSRRSPKDISRPRANLLPYFGSWMMMKCGGWCGDLSEEYHWGGINNEVTSLTHGNIVKTYNIRNEKWFYIYLTNIFITLLINFFFVECSDKNISVVKCNENASICFHHSTAM